ncbi:hypothetical protein D6779_11120 [Candidatus Parcubacteria bacterium]|nr:MAG: hypothetical protein D6779_11120 [Candidatus Parcubacteria bacterium]
MNGDKWFRKFFSVFEINTDQMADGEIHIMRTGVIYVPILGPDGSFESFEITESMLDEMVANFDKPVFLNVDHGNERIGDVVQIRKDDGGKSLRGFIRLEDFVNKDLIKSGVYQYVSAEFFEQYPGADGQNIGAKLIGVALTNRPLVTGLDKNVFFSISNYKGVNDMEDKSKENAKIEELEDRVAQLTAENERLSQVVARMNAERIVASYVGKKIPAATEDHVALAMKDEKLFRGVMDSMPDLNIRSQEAGSPGILGREVESEKPIDFRTAVAEEANRMLEDMKTASASDIIRSYKIAARRIESKIGG